MKEFTIAKNDAGQRLDRWLAKTLPLLPAPLAQKYIRLKRVKVNGKGSKRDVRLQVGDVLQLYINDEFFDRPTPENAFLSLYQPKLNILYEDEHILLLDKRPGLVVHPDETERVNTLLTHIQAYLYQKKEWSPYKENSFAPALCNRIDRNTGGIVIAAKTAEALRVMNQKIKDRELSKFYLCAVLGRMDRCCITVSTIQRWIYSIIPIQPSRYVRGIFTACFSRKMLRIYLRCGCMIRKATFAFHRQIKLLRQSMSAFWLIQMT